MKIFSKDNRVSVLSFIILGIIYVILTGVFVNMALGSLDDAYYGLTELSDESFVTILKQMGIAYGTTFVLGMMILFVDAKVRSKSIDIVNILMQMILIAAYIFGINIILHSGHEILLKTPDLFNSFYHVAIEYLCVPLIVSVIGIGISRYYKKYIGVAILGIAAIANVAIYFTSGCLYITAVMLGLSFLYSLVIKK